MNSIDISHSQEILTVTQLNREARILLEGTFPFVWVEGEISNFSAPHSGHWYFSLKDANAQIRCAMFRPQNRRLTLTAKDGMHVFVKARVTLYEGRGEFQLIVEHLEDVGVGKLQKEFEKLKNKLLEAGLFDEKNKKELPLFPQTIGIITSPTGAAIRDILSVLKRRYPSAPLIIYPTLVQGELAAPNIIKAIETANSRQECDVLILARGGGSIEDLWPFNEESVAYAIFKSHIPIISGVGHEIDFTIADFVADKRAPTPSAAAEMISPHSGELLNDLNQKRNHLLRIIKQKFYAFFQHLEWLLKHLNQQHPKRRLAEQQQKLDYLEAQLINIQNKMIHLMTTKIETIKERFLSKSPHHFIIQLNQTLFFQHERLMHLMTKKLSTDTQQLHALAEKLDALSPLSTLQRGFAIATDKDQHILFDTEQVKTGDTISVRLAKGSLDCEVVSIVGDPSS